MVVLCKEKKFFIGLSLGFLRMMFAVGSQVLNLSGYPSQFHIRFLQYQEHH